MSGYFEYLGARRAALRAEIARIDSIAAHRTATVDVFRALGTDPGAPYERTAAATSFTP